MQFFYLLLGGLATYRLSLLISKEDGPAYIFRKLRKMPPSTSIREGLSCEWCMSMWAGALVAAYYWWLKIIPGAEWPLYWLAMSALGIICNQQWTTGSKKKCTLFNRSDRKVTASPNKWKEVFDLAATSPAYSRT